MAIYMDIEREPGVPTFHYSDLAQRADEILDLVASGACVELHDGQTIVARIEPVTDPMHEIEFAQKVDRLKHAIASAQKQLNND